MDNCDDLYFEHASLQATGAYTTPRVSITEVDNLFPERAQRDHAMISNPRHKHARAHSHKYKDKYIRVQALTLAVI